MAKFEKVSKFAEADINLPQRKTAHSAGYDIEAIMENSIPDDLIDFYNKVKYKIKTN